MATGADVENLMTCGLCKCKYDNDNREPKFLQCAHTACLLCLKEICRGNLIKCPFCPEISVKLNVESLPNNPYALHMLNIKGNEKELPKSIQVVTNPSAISWCLTCSSAEKLGCAPSGHSSVDMTRDTIRNFEGLLKSKEELMKMKETGMEKLTTAVEERIKVHEQLALILKSIQHSEEEIKKLQNENNAQIIQMFSVLERSGSNAGGAKDVPAKKELYFSQLMSIVEGSTADDTVDTLKQKMEKSIELYDEKRRDSMALNSEYEFRKRVKIVVHLFDENNKRIPTVPLLENGFRFQPLCPSLTGSEIQQDSLLVSHAVFSLLKHQKIQLKREEPAGASAIMEEPKTVISFRSRQPCQSSVLFLPSSVRPVKKFFLDNLSIFKFRIFHSGHLKEEMFIRPVLTNSKVCDFVQKLGQFCFKTQKVFCSKIDEALAGVYVKFPMSNAQFQPSLDPQEKNLVDATQHKSNNGRVVFANQMEEVGLLFENEQVSSDSFTDWSFIFPLENFQNQNNVAHVKEVSECVLFGRVISRQMMDTVTKLSSTKERQRSGYTITLESQ